MNYDDTRVSDEILSRAQEDIDKLLKNKRISETERVQLEVQSYFLMFLVSDHKKVIKMFPWFEKQAAKELRQQEWMNKFQWVIIPIIVSGLLIFLGQAVYFWIVVVPTLVGK